MVSDDLPSFGSLLTLFVICMEDVYKRQECEQLDAQLERDSSNVIIYNLKHFSLDDAFNMAKNYMGSESSKLKSKLVMLYSEKETSYIMIPDGNTNCGSLVKEYADVYKRQHLPSILHHRNQQP